MKRLNDSSSKSKIEPLHVFFGAERGGGKSLRLAAGEKSRAVHARQHSHFASDLANLIERARIGTAAANQHIVAENAFAQTLECAIGQLALSSSSSGIGGEDFRLDRVHQAIAFVLRMLGGVESVAQAIAVLLCRFPCRAPRRTQAASPSTFSGFTCSLQIANRRDDLADLRVPEFQSVGHGFFRNFQRARFHHHDRFVRARNDDVQQAGLLLGDGRVDHQLAIEQAHAHAGDRDC